MACRKPGRILGSIAADFVIAEWKDDDGPVGPPRLIARLHVHHQDDEAWYVLEGQLCVRRRQEVVEARAGSAVFVPRGTAHTYWNPAPVTVRYLLILTPSFYSLLQKIHSMKDRSFPALRAVFQKHDSDLLGD